MPKHVAVLGSLYKTYVVFDGSRGFTYRDVKRTIFCTLFTLCSYVVHSILTIKTIISLNSIN
jgi:hypothetical protein